MASSRPSVLKRSREAALREKREAKEARKAAQAAEKARRKELGLPDDDIVMPEAF